MRIVILLVATLVASPVVALAQAPKPEVKPLDKPRLCYKTKAGKQVCLDDPPEPPRAGVEPYVLPPGTGTGSGVGGSSAYIPPDALKDLRREMLDLIERKKEMPS